MMETASSPPSLAPADLQVGQEVDVEARTWSGINKPGGHATISQIHRDEAGHATRVDVKYVLGGREANLELTYVRAHVELERGGRSRRRDRKMNLGALGGAEPEKKRGRKKANNGSEGNKRRKALASIDENHEKAQREGEDESSPRSKDAGDTAVVDDGADGGWTLIKDGKLSDYTSILDKGRRIKYWWSDEDGWLPGTISKALNKTVTTSTIRWCVGVVFDNGDEHGKLDFHPKEKRWKVSNSESKPPAKKQASAASKKASKPVAEKKRGRAADKVVDMIEVAQGMSESAYSANVAHSVTEVASGLYGKYVPGAGQVDKTGPHGKWELIKDGKISDFTDILQKGRRIAYWYNVEDGWLKGTIAKALNKTVTTSTIRWCVSVNFDNGNKHKLDFHPKDKRWKVFYADVNVEAAASGSAKPSAKKASAAKSSRAKFSVDQTKGQKLPAKAHAHQMKAKAATKDSGLQAPSFGSQLQSKIKELSSKMHKANASSSGGGDTGLVNYSPNSILAVKAAHSKAAMASSYSTDSLGASPSCPPDIHGPDGKANHAQGLKDKAARARATQVSLISPPSPALGTHHEAARTEGNAPTASWKDAKAMSSKGSMSYFESMKLPGAQTVSQSIYKNQCEKADQFVGYMTGPSKASKKGESSSPGSGDGDLELKLDEGRVDLFNSALGEIMFRRGIDAMDVEEMIEKANATLPLSSKRFTLLEIKPYLQKLDIDGRIFVVEDEGKQGTVYTM